MDDLLQNPEDKVEVEPASLGPEFVGALTSSLAKILAGQHQKPWTDAQETELQEKIAALVAAASRLGLKTINLVVTRPTGQKTVRELDIDRISRTRSLQ
jgi:hypothetical protein